MPCGVAVKSYSTDMSGFKGFVTPPYHKCLSLISKEFASRLEDCYESTRAETIKRGHIYKRIMTIPFAGRIHTGTLLVLAAKRRRGFQYGNVDLISVFGAEVNKYEIIVLRRLQFSFSINGHRCQEINRCHFPNKANTVFRRSFWMREVF